MDWTGSSGSSELLRPQQREQEVGEQGEGDQPDEEVLHGGAVSEFLAEPGVEAAGDEEEEERSEKQEVGHVGCPFQRGHLRSRVTGAVINTGPGGINTTSTGSGPPTRKGGRV
jgi:hypothetical protein